MGSEKFHWFDHCYGNSVTISHSTNRTVIHEKIIRRSARILVEGSSAAENSITPPSVIKNASVEGESRKHGGSKAFVVDDHAVQKCVELLLFILGLSNGRCWWWPNIWSALIVFSCWEWSAARARGRITNNRWTIESLTIGKRKLKVAEQMRMMRWWQVNWNKKIAHFFGVWLVGNATCGKWPQFIRLPLKIGFSLLWWLLNHKGEFEGEAAIRGFFCCSWMTAPLFSCIRT